MRVKSLILYGIIFGALWNIGTVTPVILTTTLITGLMGGFLIGRMNLGTFLGLLSTNGSSLANLPILSSLIPREEETKAAASPPIISTYYPQLIAPTVANSFASPAPLTYYYYNGAVVAAPQVSSPQAPTIAPASSVLPQQQSSVDFSIFPIKPADVPISLDNKIRERFIRQLALMDPLNCLPKIFCEVSSDPYGTAVALDHGTIAAIQPASTNHKISLPEMEAYEIHLQKQTSTTTTTTTTTPKPLKDETQDDKSGSEEDDESGSNESESTEDDSFERYKKEKEHKIEMDALEEMVDEIEDPLTYLYILQDKEKKKNDMKKYRDKHKSNDEEEQDEENPSLFRQEEEVVYSYADDADGHHSPHLEYYEDATTTFHADRRFASEPLPPMQPQPPPRPPLFRPSSMLSGGTEAPLRDMFSDDPFFDDFTSSSSRSGRRARQFLYGENGEPDLNRRMGRNTAETDLMKQYRAAYQVAEKYRSPEMCKVAFPSCPYQTKTILNVVNRLESGLLPFDFKKGQVYKPKNGNKNNIDQFKNTLLAIERLNKATIEAQSRGEPLDLDKLMEVAASPTVNIDANTSKNIVKEFQQVVSKIKTAKLKKLKSKKKKIKKRKNYDAVHYYKKAQMEKLKPKEQAKPKNPLDPYRKKSEDDETQVLTRRKWENVPTFKETYSNMFKVPKPKPKPVFPTTKPPMSPLKVNRVTVKPIRKFSEFVEDDEKDARDSEEAINALISKPKSNRSPIF